MSKFYITSTLPYTNSNPHIGFALEIVQTDVIARYRRLLGEEVFFNTGTDEHGLKIYKAATDKGVLPQKFVDIYAEKFKELMKVLNVSNTYFVRTTDSHHVKAAQEFWKLCSERGDIYKKNYKVKYCVGCELEKTDSELVDGNCPIHPNLKLEEIEEENYFFKFSNYQKPLLKFYKENPDFVLPDFRFNEIKKFVEDGLRDFSVSRLKSKMPWGVPVPNDDKHSMFVWFDALVGYISALGWPDNLEKFNLFWPGMQTAGKDNLRQQSAIWQAMLMSAGLKNSKQILIHGFINIEGQKISKSLGNVVDPFVLVEKYGLDMVRYFLLREIPSTEDGDFSYKKLEERYNGDLANGLGNLVQRVLTLIDTKMNGELIFKRELVEQDVKNKIDELMEKWKSNINSFALHEALGNVWELIGLGNKYTDDKKPWAAIKHDEKEFLAIMTNLVAAIYSLAWMLQPFMPETADKILESFGADKSADILENYKFIIKKGEGLFPRLS
ncbi:MAG TPA: methionine--tRNA ligase [Candidatus Paceibacterota bacterium]